MKIIEQTPQRLVLQQKRGGMAVVMAIFTLLSVFALLNLLLQGIASFSTLQPFERLSWVTWTLLIGVVVGIGGILWTSTARGTTCTFDKAAESVLISVPRLWRLRHTEHPIYAVSRIEAEHNAESKVYGLFLVLRSGERIALATMLAFEQDAVEGVVYRVRDFLRAAPQTA